MTIEKVAHLIHQEQKLLYNIARGMMKNEQDALDVVSEAACRAMEKAHTLRAEAAAKAWLLTIVTNCARSALRKNKPTLGDKALEQLQTPDETPGVDLKELVERLPVKEREAVLLKFYAGFGPSEIARLKHLPESTVRARLKRALSSMKIQLEEAES